MRRATRMLCQAPEGLNFNLSAAQQSLQELAKRFSRDVIAPAAPALDRTGEYPHDIFKQAWEAGLVNLHIPQSLGGAGASCLDGVLVSEQFAWACTGVSTALEANSLAAAPLLAAANESVQKKFLGRLTEAPLHASYCVTEPTAGSDVAAIRTTAVRKGTEWVLNGEKMWITGGGVANWYFVLARAVEEPNKPFVAFAVDAEAKGVEKGRKEINMGQRCSDTRGIRFDNVVVPEADMVGGVGDGFKIAMKAFDRTRPPVAAGALGLSQRCLDEARQYAKQRKTFGKPIASHQAVAFMIADMAAQIEATRLLTYKAAAMIDGGQRNTTIASCAKLLAAEMAQQCANNAVQIFGGNGYNTDYPVEKLYRDCKIFSIYEGTSQIQRMIISRAVLEE